MAADPCQNADMNTTTATDAMLARVRALLAKAERTDNPHEAEAFSAKAAELMDRYRIDMAQVRPEEGPTFIREVLNLNGTPYLRASFTLLMTVARHFGVVILIPVTGNRKRPTLHGARVDIEATKMMFASLLMQRDRAVLAEPVTPGMTTLKFRNSFSYGYAYRIGQRLDALRRSQIKAANVEHNPAALAVYQRETAVERWLEEERGKPLGNVNSNAPKINGLAAAIGSERANGADLGGSRLGGNGPLAIGTAR